ncbi:apolipoprotein D-like [Atheta coriaria]|uniref:apolipoprotein D-like n=1 Tax=Dalotia coriaria TaxID=877792 RepID=UPI0031F3457E
MIFLLVAVSTLVAVHAQIPNVGWCPEYLPMTDFDMNRFLGKWYEAERYFTFSEIVSRCVVTDYAKSASGRIFVSNEVTNRLTGVKRVINGNMEVLGKGDEGRIHVKYATTPIPTETTLTILDTDYDNFAVVWSCNGFGPVHTENAWLMTRERLPSHQTLQKGYGILDKFKISRTFFVKTDQAGCFLAASDINASNGITAQSTIPEHSGSPQTQENDEELRTSGVKEETETKPEIPKENEEKKPEITEIKPENIKVEKEEVQKTKEETPKDKDVPVVSVPDHILKNNAIKA